MKHLVQNCMEQPHDNIVCSDLGRLVKPSKHLSLLITCLWAESCWEAPESLQYG